MHVWPWEGRYLYCALSIPSTVDRTFPLRYSFIVWFYDNDVDVAKYSPSIRKKPYNVIKTNLSNKITCYIPVLQHSKKKKIIFWITSSQRIQKETNSLILTLYFITQSFKLSYLFLSSWRMLVHSIDIFASFIEVIFQYSL